LVHASEYFLICTSNACGCVYQPITVRVLTHGKKCHLLYSTADDLFFYVSVTPMAAKAATQRSPPPKKERPQQQQQPATAHDAELYTTPCACSPLLKSYT
jgi:hypothetical protein